MMKHGSVLTRPRYPYQIHDFLDFPGCIPESRKRGGFGGGTDRFVHGPPGMASLDTVELVVEKPD